MALDAAGSVFSGTVERILRYEPSGGAQRLLVRPDEGAAPAWRVGADGLVLVVGRGTPPGLGERLEASGEWIRDAARREGCAFSSVRLDARPPASTEGIREWLAGGRVKGVGAKSAAKLADVFRDRTEGEGRLASVMGLPATLAAAGIPQDQAKAVAEAWNSRRAGGALTAVFERLDVPARARKAVLDHYGAAKAEAAVLADPYQAAKEARGFGFDTADRIFLSMGKASDDPRRLAAVLREAMAAEGRNGQCAADRTRIAREAGRRAPAAGFLQWEDAIDAMVASGDLAAESVGGRDLLYERSVLECEIEVAERLSDLRGPRGRVLDPAGLDARIDAVAAALGVPPLHARQRDGARAAVTDRLAVLTGSPGTGKTSAVSVFLGCLNALFPDLRTALAAPTGRAAQRLAESTGHPATTLHRLLSFDPSIRRFRFDADNPLPVDALVIDEASMLDLRLCRDVLRALPDGASLFLVGDADQLPSVGAGNVLSDLIASKACPVVRLTKIFRQGAGSTIAACAQDLNRGVVPPLRAPAADADMWHVAAREPQDALDALRDLVSVRLPRMGMDPRRALMVLAPGHEGPLGTKALNAFLQEILNPAGPDKAELSDGERILREGDRVIQTINAYDRGAGGVFNGDLGFVSKVEPADAGGTGGARITVVFGDPADALDEGEAVEYQEADLGELLHACCVSIHKSQGSEFPAVAVVLGHGPKTLLTRNLLYTALSRAKRLCLLAAVPESAAKAARDKGSARLTGLAHRLSAKVRAAV